MSLLSEKALYAIACAIEPHTFEIRQRQGFLTDADIKRLAKEHAPHAIQSDRSCQIVDDYLSGERILEIQ
jgi:hypothetical protein